MNLVHFSIVHDQSQEPIGGASRIKKPNGDYVVSKESLKNCQHPALLFEHDLKQDCVGAKWAPRNFKHRNLSPIRAF